MNKYQEALDLKFEKTYIIDLHLEKFPEAQEALYKNEEFKENINKTEEFSNKYKQATADALQELVDKETPKKVKPFPNSFFIKICPNCGSTLEIKRNYCDECGQALDWSKDE